MTASADPLRSFYAGEVPAQVGVLLEQAMSAYADTEQAEAYLRQAHAAAPEALSVYFSMYKFYFYKGRLADAERVVRMALEAAALQGGFPNDIEALTPATVDWQRYDAPQHFYLFSLKALAFIRLRRGDREDCERLLAKLGELDRTDSVGASVIRAFADGSAA